MAFDIQPHQNFPSSDGQFQIESSAWSKSPLREIMTQYFDPSGTYKAYSNDDKYLFNETGEPIGYFSNGFLYDTKGMAIGHVKGKLILDKRGHPLFYTT